MASILGQHYPSNILGAQPPLNILGGRPSFATMYPGVGMNTQPLPSASTPWYGEEPGLLAKTLFGIRDMALQANQAMPWGGNDPSAIGIDTQAGTIDPSVMVPFATNVAGMATTGSMAAPGVGGAVGAGIRSTLPDAGGLPMDYASRMARANAQYPATGYHGTSRDIPEFSGSTWIADDPKVAGYYADRSALRDAMDEVDFGYDEVPDLDAIDPRYVGDLGVGELSGQNVMPLRYDPGKQLDMSDLGDAPDLRDLADFLEEKKIIERVSDEDLDEFWRGEIYTGEDGGEPTLWKAIEDLGLADDIRRAGYDSIKINDIVSNKIGTQNHEAVLMLNPTRIRSTAAAFDPAQASSPNILASNSKPSAAIGATILGGQEKRGIRAYHGSPHDFDRFSMDKIGTGEGAQAYGRGLYFAENEGVARSYRDQLKRGDNNSIVHIGDRDFPSDMGNYYLRQEMEKAVPPDGTAFVSGRETYDFYNKELGDAAYRGLKRAAPTDDPVQAMAEAMDAKIKALSPYEDELPSVMAMRDAALEYAKENVRLSPNGRMYEVEIDASPDEFIDYDAPWADQPDVVKQHFSHLAKNGTGPDGSDLARRIESGVWIDEARAAGIKGIRYKDAGSRGFRVQGFYDGKEANAPRTFNTKAEADKWAEYLRSQGLEVKEPEATSNFVIFDDNIINILKKYGLAGLTGGGAAAMALGGSSQDASAAQPTYRTGGGF